MIMASLRSNRTSTKMGEGIEEQGEKLLLIGSAYFELTTCQTHDVFTHVLSFNPLNALGYRHSTEAKIHTHRHTGEDWQGSG